MNTVYTSGQLGKFTALLQQKGVDREKFQAGLSTGFLAEVAEALALVDLTKVDRIALRQAMGLGPIGNLLELFTVVDLPAVERFVARDHFKVDVSVSARVKISYLGENFKERYLGKTEENVGAESIKIHRLLKPARDPQIIAELDGKEVTALAHLFELLTWQPHGEEGNLPVNGYAFIVYVPSVTGEIGAVRVDWYGDGWGVYADPVGLPRGWGGGRFVGSR
jgi:hypothetical protein